VLDGADINRMNRLIAPSQDVSKNDSIPQLHATPLIS
jgi:hypothetical protein